MLLEVLDIIVDLINDLPELFEFFDLHLSAFAANERHSRKLISNHQRDVVLDVIEQFVALMVVEP